MLSNSHFKARKPQALKASGDIHTNWLGTTGAFCLSPGLVGASGGGSTRHTTHTCTDRVAHPRNILIAGLHYGVHTMWRVAVVGKHLVLETLAQCAAIAVAYRCCRAPRAAHSIVLASCQCDDLMLCEETQLTFSYGGRIVSASSLFTSGQCSSDFSPASRLRVGRRAQAGTAAMSDVRFWGAICGQTH